MNTYNPFNALLIFLGICLLGYLFFRPKKGWFWLIKNNATTNEKVIAEDILKRLYHNENASNFLNINDVVRILKQDEKMVIGSIDNMVTLGWVKMEGDIIRLTKSGSDYALRIIRAHRLWERYLAEKTGFNKSEWHQRAERKEHELSMDDTNLLAKTLGNPQFDPHGDPIPTISGKIAKLKGVPVSELNTRTIGRIIHIKDKPDIIYKQIMAENIHIGSIIRIVEKSSERIVFHSEGEAFKLAPIVAGNITVSVLEKNVSYEEDILRLNSLKKDESAKIIGISKEIRGESRRRLLDLGFVKGADVSIDLMNPLGEPKAYSIKGTSIALRNNQASKILIKK